MQAETACRLLHVKGGAIEMTLTKGTPYLQLLTNGQGLLGMIYLVGSATGSQP